MQSISGGPDISTGIVLHKQLEIGDEALVALNSILRPARRSILDDHESSRVVALEDAEAAARDIDLGQLALEGRSRRARADIDKLDQSRRGNACRLDLAMNGGRRRRFCVSLGLRFPFLRRAAAAVLLELRANPSEERGGGHFPRVDPVFR